MQKLIDEKVKAAIAQKEGATDGTADRLGDTRSEEGGQAIVEAESRLSLPLLALAGMSLLVILPALIGDGRGLDWTRLAFFGFVLVILAFTFLYSEPPPTSVPSTQRQRRKRATKGVKATEGGAGAKTASASYHQINTVYQGVTCLSASPSVYLCEGFLGEGECERLLAAAEGPLSKDPEDFQENDEVKTSRSCMLRRERPECQSLLHKVSLLTGIDPERMEDPQVSRYLPGEFYSEHYDGPHIDDREGSAFLACGGQRVLTVLVYLNHVPRGGKTRFGRLDLEVSPSQGRALVFMPSSVGGHLDLRLLHEGLPPKEGTKWICQVWVRQRRDTKNFFMNSEHAL